VHSVMHYDVDAVPKPVQQPYPPLRVVLTRADIVSSTGRLGYPVFGSANTPLRERHSNGGNTLLYRPHFG